MILPILWWWSPGLFTVIDQGTGPTLFTAQVASEPTFVAARVNRAAIFTTSRVIED